MYKGAYIRHPLCEYDQLYSLKSLNLVVNNNKNFLIHKTWFIESSVSAVTNCFVIV